MRLNPCFLFQKSKRQQFNLTPDQRRPIWEYMKANYFDKGVGFGDAIRDISHATGHPPEFFWDAIAGPKSFRLKTNQIYRKDAMRRAAKEAAEHAIKNADTPEFVKVLKALTGLPRAILTFGHGPVFPVTHAGSLLLRPTEWRNFADGWWKSMRALSDTYYGKLRDDLVSHHKYATARQAGLKIDPNEGPQGILTHWLTSKPGWSRKAWLGLQHLRLNVWTADMEPFEAQLKTGQITPEQYREVAKHMAEIANHATGVTNYRVGPLSYAMFAPQLSTSKFARAFIDPVKTFGTFARMSTGLGRQVNAGERAAAYKRLGNAVEFMTATFSGLLLNQALMSALGSKQQVNLTDPKKADFWRFKTGDGHVLSTRGPEEMLRLIGDLIAISYASKKELKGESQRQAAADSMMKFLQYKLSPGIGLSLELAYGRDVFLRPLPEPVQKAREAIGMKRQEETPAKPQYGTLEYMSQHGPIFIGGGARDFYNQMRERGMSAEHATAMMRAALISAGEFFGFGAYEETPPSPQARTARTRQVHREALRRIVGEE